ncbi:MAG: MOSC domain-containing protein [Nitrospirae bacterium]|nr:MOSC domain-containing protein [Nitrospirota bacterium]
MMLIESLNIGLPKKETFHGKEITTGICKTPAFGLLNLTADGFEKDGVGDLKHHGGHDKAVCVYSLDHYPYWEELLGIKLPEAAFGENLTVSGLRENEVCIGDIYEAGPALLQVSQPRQPCRTLSVRYGRDDMIKLVRDSGLTGFYFRVLRTGSLKKGDQLQLKEKDKNGVSIAFANSIYHHRKTDCEGIERVLDVDALSASWKKSFLELKQACS